ncbi:MAG: hypothetical protein ACRENX_08990, partial [Candidatus Dormibacteria bacterium]
MSWGPRWSGGGRQALRQLRHLPAAAVLAAVCLLGSGAMVPAAAVTGSHFGPDGGAASGPIPGAPSPALPYPDPSAKLAPMVPRPPSASRGPGIANSSVNVGGAYTAVVPFRLVDTRAGSGYYGQGQPLGPGATFTFPV